MSQDNGPFTQEEDTMDLRKRTQQLWRAYLMAEEPEALSQVLEWIDADCVVIGTGRHEY